MNKDSKIKLAGWLGIAAGISLLLVSCAVVQKSQNTNDCKGDACSGQKDPSCHNNLDDDGDNLIDQDDIKCQAINSVGERKNFALSATVPITASKGGTVGLGEFFMENEPGALSKDATVTITREPAKQQVVLSVKDIYTFDVNDGSGKDIILSKPAIILNFWEKDDPDLPSDMSDYYISIDEGDGDGYLTPPGLQIKNGSQRYIMISVDKFSENKPALNNFKK